MLNVLKITLLCQLGMLSVSCNEQQGSGFLLQCDSSCILPEFPGNGRYKVLGDTADTLPGAVVSNLTVIQYQCDVGYVPYPHSTAVCNGGTWDTQFTKCQRKVTCPSPVNPAHGSYEISNSCCPLIQGSEVPNYAVVTYSCDVAFEIVGNRTALCYNGLWTTEPPQCQRSTSCILPDLPKRGSYSIVGSVEAPVPGAVVPENKALRYNCTTNNGGPPDQVIVCSEGKWLPGVVKCVTPSDCEDVLGITSGVYVIQPISNRAPFDVYCDLTLAGQKWTVIQQRFNGDVDFYRSYKEYSKGFGTKSKNHWLGLEHIHEITREGHYELYVDLEAHNGTKAYARYDTFIVGNSSTGFQLTIDGYSGTAGDSMYDTKQSRNSNNGMKFTTFDKDQDNFKGNRADYHHGGWWYNWGSVSNLNGRYYDTAVDNWETMYWYYNFKKLALKSARMLIRRR